MPAPFLIPSPPPTLASLAVQFPRGAKNLPRCTQYSRASCNTYPVGPPGFLGPRAHVPETTWEYCTEKTGTPLSRAKLRPEKRRVFAALPPNGPIAKPRVKTNIPREPRVPAPSIDFHHAAKTPTPIPPHSCGSWNSWSNSLPLRVLRVLRGESSDLQLARQSPGHLKPPASSLPPSH